MPKIIIVCHRYLNSDTKTLAVGGVETYAGNLVSLLLSMDYDITLYQLGNKEEKYVSSDKRVSVSFFLTLSDIEKAYIKTRDNFDKKILLTFSFGHLVRKNEKVIIVQHGIEFDGYTCTKTNPFLAFLQRLILRNQLFNYKRRLKKILRNGSKIVCVDLNFINFVRIFRRFERYEEKLVYIPNFSDVNPNIPSTKESSVVKVLIPRRFEYHRGIPLYSKVVDKLLTQVSNVEFTFAGEGVFEESLKKKYANEPRVKITRAPHDKLMKMYEESDICIIPTLYSEGTSLSAIEAMANHCAVIVTNIGGLGNLVFPNYNGLICGPTEDALYAASYELIENAEKRQQLADNAYRVVQCSFSNAQWRNSWKSLIQSL